MLLRKNTGIEKVYDDFHEMFIDPEYRRHLYHNAPQYPHRFMKQAIWNGKRCWWRNPTLNSSELEEAIAHAKEHGVVIGEAMTIYAYAAL